MNRTHLKSGPLDRIESILSRFCHENPCNNDNIPGDFDENIDQPEIDIDFDFAIDHDENVNEQKKISHQSTRKNPPQKSTQPNNVKKPIRKASNKTKKNVSKKATLKSKRLDQEVMLKSLKSSSNSIGGVSPIIMKKDLDVDKIVPESTEIQPDLETNSEDVENQNFLSAMKKLTDEKIKVGMNTIMSLIHLSPKTK